MELTVGASIFIALFILIAGVMWLKEISVASKMVEYTVLFPEVGTLQKGDPVTVNGVKRGSASHISLYKAQAAVVIKLDKNVVLTDSCKITIQNIGLMGERKIGIQLSEKGTPYKPNTKKQATYITGYFDTGIAEAMGMLGRVLLDVQSLLGILSNIIEKTVGDTDFLELFDNILARVDTITILAEDLVVKNKPDLDRTMDNLHRISADVKSLIDVNGPHISSIMENGAQLTTQALSIADNADSIAQSLKSMINAIDNGEGSIGMLLKDENFYTDLKSSLADLDTLIQDVNNNGLKLRIKLGFRKDRNKK